MFSFCWLTVSFPLPLGLVEFGYRETCLKQILWQTFIKINRKNFKIAPLGCFDQTSRLHLCCFRWTKLDTKTKKSSLKFRKTKSGVSTCSDVLCFFQKRLVPQLADGPWPQRPGDGHVAGSRRRWRVRTRRGVSRALKVLLEMRLGWLGMKKSCFVSLKLV